MAGPEHQQQAAGSAAGRGVRVALVLSLALNLLFVGLIVGAAVGGHPMRRPGMGPDAGFGPMTDALTRDDRRALRAAFEARAPDLRAARAEMRADFQALSDSLAAEPWDAAAVEAILTRIGERGAERMRLGREVFMSYLGGLSPDERRALAERISRGLARRAGG